MLVIHDSRVVNPVDHCAPHDGSSSKDALAMNLRRPNLQFLHIAAQPLIMRVRTKTPASKLAGAHFNEITLGVGGGNG